MSISKVGGRSGFPFNVSGKIRWSSFHFQGEGGPRDFLPISREGKVLWISFEFQSELGGVRWMSFPCQGGGSSGFPFNFKVAGASGVLSISKGFETEPFGFPLKFRAGSSGVIFDFRRMAMPWISIQFHRVGL